MGTDESVEASSEAQLKVLVLTRTAITVCLGGGKGEWLMRERRDGGAIRKERKVVLKEQLKVIMPIAITVCLGGGKGEWLNRGKSDQKGEESKRAVESLNFYAVISLKTSFFFELLLLLYKNKSRLQYFVILKIKHIK